MSDGLSCGQPVQASWPSETPSFPEGLASSPSGRRPQSCCSFRFHFNIFKSITSLRGLTMFLHGRKVTCKSLFFSLSHWNVSIGWSQFLFFFNFLKSCLGYVPFPGLQLEIFHSFNPYSLLFLPTVRCTPLFRVEWMQLGFNYSLVCKEISQQLFQASKAHLRVTPPPTAIIGNLWKQHLAGGWKKPYTTKYWYNSSNPDWCAAAELCFIPTWCHRWAETQN